MKKNPNYVFDGSRLIYNLCLNLTLSKSNHLFQRVWIVSDYTIVSEPRCKVTGLPLSRLKVMNTLKLSLSAFLVTTSLIKTE